MAKRLYRYKCGAGMHNIEERGRGVAGQVGERNQLSCGQVALETAAGGGEIRACRPQYEGRHMGHVCLG